MSVQITAERSPVLITAAEFARLAPLARAERTPGADLLRQELDRATIIWGGPRPDVAHLGSVVTYLDRASGRARTIRLVLPEQAGGDDQAVSILTPLGAALLGLAEGQTFRWRSSASEDLDLEIIGVTSHDEIMPEGGVRYFRRAPNDRASSEAVAMRGPVSSRPPPVHVIDDEYERLSDFVCSSPIETEAIALLWAELDRAAIVRPEQAPGDLVRMNSVVRFTELLTSAQRTVRLAYPDDPGLGETDVPVTSTLGAALIGLRAGSTFAWTSLNEGARMIRIEEVEAPSPPGGTPYRHTRRRRRPAAARRTDQNTRSSPRMRGPGATGAGRRPRELFLDGRLAPLTDVCSPPESGPSNCLG